MKLKFTKNEKCQINVVQVIEEIECEFSYVNLIKSLIESKQMEEPEILGEFTEAEKRSIKSMTEWINKTVVTATDAEVISEKINE